MIAFFFFSTFQFSRCKFYHAWKLCMKKHTKYLNFWKLQKQFVYFFFKGKQIRKIIPNVRNLIFTTKKDSNYSYPILNNWYLIQKQFVVLHLNYVYNMQHQWRTYSDVLLNYTVSVKFNVTNKLIQVIEK